MNQTIDYSSQIDKIILVGNAAHDIRNLLAMKKRIDLPELIVIDNASATIENQSRQIAQIFKNDMNGALVATKPILRAIQRANQFIIRMIDDFDLLEYESLLQNDTQDLKKTIQTEVQLVKEVIFQISQFIENSKVDDYLNSIYSGFIENKTTFEARAKVTQEINDFIAKYDFTKQPQFRNNEANTENLIQYTKDLCNRAHNIQNTICYFQNIEKTKAQANQINNIAGQIENQFRAILTSFDQNWNQPEQIKKVITNQTKAMGEELGKIEKNCDVLKNIDIAEFAVETIQEHMNWIWQSQSIFEQVCQSKAGELTYKLI